MWQYVLLQTVYHDYTDRISDYAKKVGSSDHLQIDVTSSVYVCGSGGQTPVTQLYGLYYDGSIPDGC